MPVCGSDFQTLDISILESLSSDRAFLTDVCNSFLADAPQRIDAVKAAIAVADPGALDDAAHAMKSLSSCLGAMSLFEVCRQMELAGKNKNIAPAQELIEQLDTEYANVQAAVRAYRTTL